MISNFEGFFNYLLIRGPTLKKPHNCDFVMLGSGKPPKKKQEKKFTTVVNYLQKWRTPPPSPYFTTISATFGT